MLCRDLHVRQASWPDSAREGAEQAAGQCMRVHSALWEMHTEEQRQLWRCWRTGGFGKPGQNAGALTGSAGHQGAAR